VVDFKRSVSNVPLIAASPLSIGGMTVHILDAGDFRITT